MSDDDNELNDDAADTEDEEFESEEEIADGQIRFVRSISSPGQRRQHQIEVRAAPLRVAHGKTAIAGRALGARRSRRECRTRFGKKQKRPCVGGAAIMGWLGQSNACPRMWQALAAPSGACCALPQPPLRSEA